MASHKQSSNTKHYAGSLLTREMQINTTYKSFAYQSGKCPKSLQYILLTIVWVKRHSCTAGFQIAERSW
jgi:hypothetical protein